jgi:glycosyltransferase involved in cell wall biosynthesis
MKILFLSDNFPPEVNAPASRTFEHCREWVQAGHQVTVITSAPNFPQGRLYPGYRNRLWSREIVDGIRVVRVWTYISANQGFAKRILDHSSFAVTAFWAGLFFSSDVILTTSPQFFTNFAGMGLSRLKGKPWIFELRDLWPDSIRTVGALRNTAILNLLEKIEISFYRRSRKVIALTPAFKRNLVMRGISAEKIEVVPNGVDSHKFHPQTKDRSLIEALGLQGKFVIGYIGTHGMAHGLDFIVSSLKEIKDRNIHFIFIGDGAEKGHVLALAKKLRLTNVKFLDPIPKDEVPRYLGICDVALVPLIKAETFKTVIPSKIFEASAMQRPILLGVDGQAKEIIDAHGAGICFEPENRRDFLSKVHRLHTDTELYKRLQIGCDRLASAYERRNLANEMLRTLSTTYSEDLNFVPNEEIEPKNFIKLVCDKPEQ